MIRESVEVINGDKVVCSIPENPGPMVITSSAIIELDETLVGEFTSGRPGLAAKMGTSLGDFEWREIFSVGGVELNIGFAQELDQHGRPLAVETRVASARLGRYEVALPAAGITSDRIVRAFELLDFKATESGVVSSRALKLTREPQVLIHLPEARVGLAVRPATKQTLAQVPRHSGTVVDHGELFRREPHNHGPEVPLQADQPTLLHVGPSTVTEVTVFDSSDHEAADFAVRLGQSIGIKWLVGALW